MTRVAKTSSGRPIQLSPLCAFLLVRDKTEEYLILNLIQFKLDQCGEQDHKIGSRAIKFDFKSGHVTYDVNIVDESQFEGSFHRKSIIPLIYSSFGEKVVFTTLPSFKILGENYPVFEIKGMKSKFYNLPHHPFHSVAMKWVETLDGVEYSYEILKFIQ